MATLLPLVEEDERNAKRGGGSSAPGSRQMTPDSAFPSEQDADGSSCNNPCHAAIPSFAFFHLPPIFILLTLGYVRAWLVRL